MDNKLNFNGKLDFNDIDLTAPDKVIEEILSQLPKETNGIIFGRIQPYDGQVFSYKQIGLAGMFATEDKQIDIQNNLGKIGEETHKFECFLYTSEYDKYKYRVFFAQYDIANYPVNIILDESVARSISRVNIGYICTCNTREELEDLIYDIFASKRMIAVMQELIRINQAKKAARSYAESAV